MLNYLFKVIYSNIYILLHFIISKLKNDKFTKTKPSINDIEILHHSNNYIIINKHYDVVMNSLYKYHTVTLQTQLRKLFPELVNPKLKNEFTFVHRLDYATSGIVCLPINKAACKSASNGFQTRAIDKYYLAIVRGHLSQNSLQIDIGVGDDTRPEFKGLRMALEGSSYVGKCKVAMTKVFVLERGICYDFPATKVLLKPLTGRRHQLRLHMNVLGHTIVGDYTYSNRRDTAPYRMFLHAYRFVLPGETEHLDFRTNDPFVEHESRNNWTPIEVVNKLNNNTMHRLKNTKRGKLITIPRNEDASQIT